MTPRADAAATADRSRAEPLWREHLGLCVTGLLLAAFLMRLMVVSRHDPTTMLAILQRTTTSTALLGFVATVAAPGAIAGFASFHALSIRRTLRSATGTPWLRLGLMAGSWAAFALFVSFLSAVLLAVLAPIVAGSESLLERLLRRPGAAPTPYRTTERLTVALAVAVVAVPMLFSDAVWLPPEELRLDDGSVVVGYTLERTERGRTVLLHDGRVVLQLDGGRVASSRYCSLSTDRGLARPLLRLLRSPAEYPRCPA